jgi:nucleotide-binding universal stress UspA family protein
MKDTRRARVVVGVGESLAALQALRYAVAEARRRGTRLRAVRVWYVNVPLGAEDGKKCRIEAGALAAATIRRSFERAMGGLPRDLDLELIAVEGALGPAIVAQTSDEVDLLVVGAPARRWWSASPFTLVRYCLRLTSCPVVVVPAPALVREHGLRASARAIQREAQRYLETSGRSS